MYIDRINNGQIEKNTSFEIVRESPTTAVIDGHHGIGMVIGFHSMNLAIKKAKEFGMGSVAVRNSTHFGIDGYYPLMAIENGMIGMSFTNARPSVSPTFSTQPKLGTNPIAFGAPTDEEFPFLFDAATSITQRGKIEVLNREEKPAYPGWVIDAEGKPMTDPQLDPGWAVPGSGCFIAPWWRYRSTWKPQRLWSFNHGRDPVSIVAERRLSFSAFRIKSGWQQRPFQGWALLYGNFC